MRCHDVAIRVVEGAGRGRSVTAGEIRLAGADPRPFPLWLSDEAAVRHAEQEQIELALGIMAEAANVGTVSRAVTAVLDECEAHLAQVADRRTGGFARGGFENGEVGVGIASHPEGA